MTSSSETHTNQPLTMIVRHRVDSGKAVLFDEWAKGIREAASQFDGFWGTEVIRPIEGSDSEKDQEYVCIIRFGSYEKLKKWVDSKQRKQWIDRTGDFSTQPPKVEHYQSLEFWFERDGFNKPNAPAAKAPPRYKMALLSFLVIWVQVTLLVPIISGWIGGPFVLITAVAVATIVLITTYLVMPLVTKLLKRWLFQ